MKIQAALIETKGEPFNICELELEPPKQGEVLIKIAACGVCHTDEVARQQIIPVPLPAVFGHEGCGTVLEVGPCVTEFKPGDKVGFSYGYCGTCEACRTGRPYGCIENRRLNFGGVQFDDTKRLKKGDTYVSSFFGQGAFASHAVVHVNNLIPVAEDIDLKMVAPMGCGIQTGAGAVLNYLKPGPDSSIIITGCGPVGLSAVMAAKIAGCTTIIACDVVQSRLELALELGATDIINSREAESVQERVCELTGGLGSNYAIDCTGIGVCVRQSLQCTRPLGTCIVLGATQDLTINVEEDLMGVGKTLAGLVEGCSIPKIFIPQLLDYYRKGMFPFDKLIKYYPFEEINEAFEDTKKGSVLKAVLYME
ncbi:NAD(P)-dependent alcohol dehydrogenase [Parasporobacterium paucivorans]|uniref:Aryl-alcohol dehydrogenase n=1 Tax=Parasporobacterium paucivorans DSM 15970 TaxID=1122934 RepID=A0A1M6HVA7_9FIRM|nr:NAD(P)-dependent alcohol dehydrogenase [Parasporobacterium paucivorans]SHJ26141.1 aryl-alcohol dehydrogenase [Parasporobacterium paucivorans DSM 15970]